MKQKILIHGNFNYLAYSVKISQVYRVDNQLIVIAGVEDNHMELAPNPQEEICCEFMRSDEIEIENAAKDLLPVKLYLILPKGCEFTTDQDVKNIFAKNEITEIDDPENIAMLLWSAPVENKNNFFKSGVKVYYSEGATLKLS